MTNQHKINAALGLAVIVGTTIALRRATVVNGAALGLPPLVAIGLVAGAARAIPKLMERVPVRPGPTQAR